MILSIFMRIQERKVKVTNQVLSNGVVQEGLGVEAEGKSSEGVRRNYIWGPFWLVFSNFQMYFQYTSIREIIITPSVPVSLHKKSHLLVLSQCCRQ